MKKMALMCSIFIQGVFAQPVMDAGGLIRYSSKTNITVSLDNAQSAVEYVRQAGRLDNDIKVRYEIGALNYVGYLVHLGSNLTEDSRNLVESLLSQNYIDEARADLLRAQFFMQPEMEDLCYKKLLELVSKYNENSFNNNFGEFMIFYHRINMIKILRVQVGGWQEDAVEAFLEKYENVATNSDVIYIAENGSLICH